MVPFGNTWTGAVDIAQHDRAQVDLLDVAGHAVDAREVADADLIFENEEEPRDHVADEILRAEADRQPRNPGAGQDRHDVDAELAQQHQDGDEADRPR